MRLFRNETNILLVMTIICGASCQKTATGPLVVGPASLIIVNAIPNSVPIIPIINTSSAITYFANAATIRYGNSTEYSPPGGNDTIYVVQKNSDTMDLGPKAIGLMFNNVLNLRSGGIYSLFLTGSDTSSPDYLFTVDSLPYHNPIDSTVGIRFVNLSSGSDPISVNLEGSPNGSEVASLSYKGITNFKNYLSDAAASVNGYRFVFRDFATGDSLTSIKLVSNRKVPGLVDPNNSSNQLTFKNVTIAFYGSIKSASMLIDDY